MRNLQNIIDKTKKCKNKRGKFDKETGMCVLPENEIETRDEAIENAIYRMCDYFVNFEEKYRDMKSCMGREGYELIEGLKDEPYQNRFFDVNAARTFMHETILGDPEGSLYQYRFPNNGWVHVREYRDYGLIHADKHKATNPLHLFEYIEYRIGKENEDNQTVSNLEKYYSIE